MVGSINWNIIIIILGIGDGLLRGHISNDDGMIYGYKVSDRNGLLLTFITPLTSIATAAHFIYEEKLILTYKPS